MGTANAAFAGYNSNGGALNGAQKVPGERKLWILEIVWNLSAGHLCLSSTGNNAQQMPAGCATGGEPQWLWVHVLAVPAVPLPADRSWAECGSSFSTLKLKVF